MAISYIGSTLSVIASTPSTVDQSGYEALSMTTVGKVTTIGELGATSEDLTINLLAAGATKHVNGTKDMGEIPVSIEFDASDGGLTILEAGNNTNTVHSFKVTDSDGEDTFFQGLIANLRDPERSSGAIKMKNFVIRGDASSIVVVDA